MGAERQRRARGLSGARLLQVQRALRVGGGGGRGAAGGGAADSSDDEGGRPGGGPAGPPGPSAAALGWSSDEEEVGGASPSVRGTPGGRHPALDSARRALRTPGSARGAPGFLDADGVGWEGREDRARAAVRSAEAAVSEAAGRTPVGGAVPANGALRRELEAALEKYGASEQGRRQEVLTLRAQLHRVQQEAVEEQRALRKRALAAEAECVQLRVQLERVLAEQAVEVAERGHGREDLADNDFEWQRERDLGRLARLVGKLQRDLEEARLLHVGGGEPLSA